MTEPQTNIPVTDIRRHFPALERQGQSRTLCYLDGPAGTQVPQSVAGAVSGYLLQNNANSHGLFPTSLETDEVVSATRAALADFLQVDDPDEIIFGPNMTTLTMAFSRAIARTWRSGDEIIVTQLDHDANVAPWLLAARDAGVAVHQVRMDLDRCELDLDHLRQLLSRRTRLVAVGVASNAVGTINRVAEIVPWVHAVGALVYLDAVHWAPHGRIDIRGWDADFLVCSAYKFCGPHLGIFWGRREHLEAIEPYKVRPAPVEIPDCWMTGTQSFEAIAGAGAAVEYFSQLGRWVDSDSNGLTRTAALDRAFQWIRNYERSLLKQLVAGIQHLEHVQLLGPSADPELQDRVPTISIRHAHYSASQLARELAAHDILAWSGNYYAYNWSQALGLPAEGAVRIGAVHYNTGDEINYLLEVLRKLSSRGR